MPLSTPSARSWATLRRSTPGASWRLTFWTAATERPSDPEFLQEKKEGRFLRREFSYSKFQQTIVLPDNVEADKIEAKMEHGVLNISIPKDKKEEMKRTEKVIEIK